MNALASFVLGLGVVVSILIVGLSLIGGFFIPAIGAVIIIMTIVFIVSWVLRLFAPKKKNAAYHEIEG